jgi:S1-C subfamily serine protease
MDVHERRIANGRQRTATCKNTATALLMSVQIGMAIAARGRESRNIQAIARSKHARAREGLGTLAESTHWAFPANLQPRSEGLRFDLASALRSVVMLRAEIPEDAFTASILGTERFGNGVVIRDDGLMLTIGYLITEAESIWLTTNDGTVIPGHPLAYDFASGLGLVLPLGQLGVPALPRGSAASIETGDDAIVIGHGGRPHALEAQVFAKREFAGFWEYVLDEALFTTPPHPEWSGAALVGMDGRLLGIGSLFVQEAVDDKGGARQLVRARRPDRTDPPRLVVARAFRVTAPALAGDVYG